jgi:hypothetical protein
MIFRNRPSLLAFVLALGVPSLVAAQPPADAAQKFSWLVQSVSSGLLFPHGFADSPPMEGTSEADARALAEQVIARNHLTEERRWATVWGGVWSAKDATGSVTLMVEAPDMFDPNIDHAWVMFRPAGEQPIPQAILSNLMSRAETTKPLGPDMLDIAFPWERETPKSKCSSQTTFTVRVTTGALLSNTVTTYCHYRQ